MTSENALSVKQVSKAFDVKDRDRRRLHAVDEVSFEVPPGSFFSFLGPSGCGKTTTLRCIAGLERPDEGTIELGGKVLFSSDHGIDVPATERRIGMVFQSYAIWPHMSVRDNVGFVLRAAPRHRRPGRAEVEERVGRALEVVGLGDLASRASTELSGGQQQRLALARALVLDSPLLLLDEPLSNLDAKLRAQMRVELKRLHRELGIAIVYVTHDRAEALSMSDVVAVMSEGRIVQQGPPIEVYRRPTSAFVADFVSDANVIDGTVVGVTRDGSATVATPAGVISVATPVPTAQNAEVSVVVHPADITLTEAPSGGNGEHKARVVGASFLGDEIEYVVEIGGLRLRALSEGGVAATPGSDIFLAFDTAACVAVPR